MHRKKFCVELNFLNIHLFEYLLIVQNFEQSDIDIDINYYFYLQILITKCFGGG